MILVDAGPIVALCDRYEEHEPDWTDAYLAVLSGREPRASVWSYDREFAAIWRRPDGKPLPLAVPGPTSKVRFARRAEALRLPLTAHRSSPIAHGSGLTRIHYELRASAVLTFCTSTASGRAR